MDRPRLPPDSAVPGPHKRANELLEQLTSGDQAAGQLFDKLFGDVQGDQDYRSGAPSVLATQDSHLQLWIDILRLYNSKSDPTWKTCSNQQVIDQTMKNVDEDQVLQNIQIFMRGAVGLTTGKDGGRPTYDYLQKYRTSAIYWVEKNMKRKAPKKEDMVNAANQTLQRKAREWGVNKTRKVKTYFGRHELAQLIDWDTARSPCLAVAESNHLAWCLGLICGVRPGSIGSASGYEDQFLSFREITITRGSAKGMFNAKVQFLYLKGNRDSLVPEDGLTFSINGSLQSGTLPMSVPHRLLVMLLRRKALKDHDTISSLLEGDEYFIAIKEAVLDQPVCRVPGPRGLSIQEDAVSGSGLTSYLSTTAMQAGYPRGITMYCWRRKAATTWMRQEGADRARQMMGHAHGSTTLEDHYDQGFYDLPVFEMAMKQDTTIGRATLDQQASEVLRRMVDTKRLRGTFLNRQVTRILEDNKEYAKAKRTNNLRAMMTLEAKARKLANDAFHDEQRMISDASLTLTEFKRREAALSEPMELVKRIRNTVKEKMRSQATPLQQDSGPVQQVEAPVPPSAQDEELQELAQDGDIDADDLIDAEDDYIGSERSASQNVTVDRPMSWDVGSEETQEEFFAAVEVFMIELGKDTFHITGENICELCRNSQYASKEDKDKVWPSPAKLKNHQMGRNHSKYGEVALKLRYLKDIDAEDKCPCPYGACDKKYNTVEKAVRHIRQICAPGPDDDLEDDERAKMQLHDDEKRADGWYDEDFEWDGAEVKKPDVLNANRRRNLGLKYTDEVELPEPKAVEIRQSYKVVVGSGGEGALMKEIPAHYRDMIAFGDDEDDDDPYEHVAPTSGPITAAGDTDTDTSYTHPIRAVPAHLKSNLQLGDEGLAFEHPGMWREFAGED